MKPPKTPTTAQSKKSLSSLKEKKKNSGFQSTFAEKFDWLRANQNLFVNDVQLLNVMQYDVCLDKKLLPIFQKMKKDGLYAPITKPESVLPNLLIFIQKVAADINHLRVNTNQQIGILNKAKGHIGQVNVLLKAATYNAPKNSQLTESLLLIQEKSLALEEMMNAFLDGKPIEQRVGHLL